MKKTILTLLFLLVAASAFGQVDAGYFIRPDCGTLSPAPYNTVCEQSTTVNGRTAGQLYVYNGTTWISVTASSSGGHVIKDEGTARPQRTNLTFIGTGVACPDNEGNDATECTIDVGGAPPFDTITTGANTTATMTVGTGGSVVPSGSGVISATVGAANGANCSAGSAAGGVDTVWAAENCTDFMEEPSGTGIVAKTAANAATGRTISGAGGITVADGDGIAGNPTISPGATIVETDQANTYGAFHQNFGAATVTLPNSAGAAPASDNQMAVDTTAGAVKVRIGGSVFSLATTLGSFDSFSADPVGCVLANGEWTNDIDASGVSNCVRVFSSGAAAPTAGTVRFVGEIYQDTRAYSCSTQTGLTYIGQTVGGNFTPILAQPDSYTTVAGDSGSVSPCGSDTLAIKSNAATAALSTVVSLAASSAPDTVTLYSKFITHATDCTAVVTGIDGQACYEQDSDRIFVCEPSAGLCDTAGEWKLATGAGGGATPAGGVDDIQFYDTGAILGGGRCTMTTGANISCAGSVTTGTANTVSGVWTATGLTSGSAALGVADAAGTPNRINLPTATGAAGAYLVTNGANPQQTSWATTNNIKPCEIIVGDPGAASPVLADDNDTPSACKNMSGATLTITSVHCYAPVGAPTVTPIITGGGATSILTGAITCSTTAGGVAGTLNGTPTQASNGTIDMNITAAGGAAKYLVVYINRSL